MNAKQKYRSLYGRYRKTSKGAYIIRHGSTHAVNYATDIRSLTGTWDLPRPCYVYVTDYMDMAYNPGTRFKRWLRNH